MSSLRDLLGQRGLFYSDKCFKDGFLIYDKDGKPIPKFEYDNITEEEFSHCKVKNNSYDITLKIGEMEFSFANGEYFAVVFDLIQKIFKDRFRYTIYDIKRRKKITATDKIDNLTKYDIEIDEYQFIFKNMKGDVSYHKLNYFATVKDAQQDIVYSMPNCLVIPNEITIYDENKKEINDQTRKLISIENFENAIFYSIKENSMYARPLSDENLTRMAKNCYSNSNVITNYLVKKGLFYSDQCMKNKLLLTIQGSEVKNDMFKRYKNVNESQIGIKEGLNTVTLDYNGMKFIFCDNEYLSVAYSLIRRTFSPCEDVSIYNDKNMKFNFSTKITKGEKYIIEVKFRFKFKVINVSDMSQVMDYLSTVSDAKAFLSMCLCGGDAEKIVMFDDNKTEIKNLSLKLIDIPNYQNKIYCEIDINRGSHPVSRTPKNKSKNNFNPKIHKKERSPSATQKYPASEYPEIKSFHYSSKQTSIQKNRDEKPHLLKPEPKLESEPKPESEPISSKLERRKVTIKGPTVSAVKGDSHEQTPIKKVIQKKQSSTDDESESEPGDELKINFIFNIEGKLIYPFKKILNSNKTIEEISKKIKEKYEIDDTITISYKYQNSFCEIDSSMNIDDIRENMVEKTSRGNENFLYIGIKKQVKRSSSDPKDKNDSDSDNEDTSPSKKTIKIPKIRPIQRKTSNDDDQDETHSPKPNKNAKKSSHVSDDDEDEVENKKSSKTKKASSSVFDLL